jgi:hypothetical protein
MNTLLTILKILPAILKAAIESVNAVEEGFHNVAEATGSATAAAGAHKAGVLESALAAILEKVDGVPVELVMKIFSAVRDAAVKAFNVLGWFKTSK